MSILRFAFLLWLLAWPLNAHPAVPATANQMAERLAADERASADERQVRDLQRSNALLEMERRLADDSYARFEIGMAGLGILITLLVLGFGFITHRGAVNAARHELGEMRDKVKALHEEAVKAKEQAVLAASAAHSAAAAAEQALDTAKGAAEGAQAHQQTAEAASMKVREAVVLVERVRSMPSDSSVSELTAKEQETVSEAAKEVAEKPKSEWSSHEFRVKIFEAAQEKRWEEVLNLTKGVEFLYQSDKEAIAFALFEQAMALGKLGRSEEELLLYKEIWGMIDADDDEPLLETAAMALFNRGVQLERVGRQEEAIAAYDAVIARFGSRDSRSLSRLTAKSLVNKGWQLNLMGRSDEAIAIADDIYAHFGNRREPELRQQVGMALFNKAASLAREKMVTPSIAALEAWKDYVGSFDCEEVKRHSEFDAIRDRASFVKFLRAQGCAD